MAKTRKWFKVLCECGNCRIQRVEQFPFGTQPATGKIVCKGCGVTGAMTVIGPAPKKSKPAATPA